MRGGSDFSTSTEIPLQLHPRGQMFFSSCVALADGRAPWETLMFPSLQDQSFWPFAKPREPGYEN